jgi:hypothetical protein
MLGSVATILCVLAIAFVGLMLMSGRFAIRDGFRVVIGCFVLLGASAIGAGLRGVANDAAGSEAPGEVMGVPAPALPELRSSGFDPYAGASLVRECSPDTPCVRFVPNATPASSGSRPSR